MGQKTKKQKKSVNKQITVFIGLVLRDGKILMVKRYEPECKGAHLKWEFPGGKADFGETPEEAIVRELKEETGVSTRVKRMLPHIETVYWDYPWGKQQTLLMGFECVYISEKKREIDHHVKEVEWVPFTDIPKRKTLPGVAPFLKALFK